MSDTLVLQSPPYRPVIGLRPDPAAARQRIAVLLAEAGREETAEDDLRQKIERLEEEADDHWLRAEDCRREAKALANPEPVFDLPLPIVVVTPGRDVTPHRLECSVCGLVRESSVVWGVIGAQWSNVQNAAKRHAEVEHDGLVVAEGWAR